MSLNLLHTMWVPVFNALSILNVYIFGVKRQTLTALKSKLRHLTGNHEHHGIRNACLGDKTGFTECNLKHRDQCWTKCELKLVRTDVRSDEVLEA